MWPETAASAFIVLLLSTFLVQRLPMYLFFIVFGILFFGTMSNYYYLLPLLYLDRLEPNNWRENVRLVFLKIIPAWAIGFIVGYAVTQLIIYASTGHLMTIAEWRDPHYIHTADDLIHNIQRSLVFLERDIKSIFSNNWMILAYLFATLIAFRARKMDLIFTPIGIFFLMIIVHYVVVLPTGIGISPRTIIATWAGIFAIAFFVPSIRQWQMTLLAPIIVFFTFVLYQNNHANLRWYASITNAHFDNLLEASPRSPSSYKGVVLLATDSDIGKRNALISKQNNVHHDANIEYLDAIMKWAPSAREAGFKSIIRCDGSNGENDLFDQVTNANLICQEIANIHAKDKVMTDKGNSFFNTLGEHDGRLIISFDQNWTK
jgi:hypothetical protein